MRRLRLNTFKVRDTLEGKFTGIDALKGEDYTIISTSNLNSVSNPKVGMMVFYTAVNKPVWYSGTSWVFADGTEVTSG